MGNNETGSLAVDDGVLQGISIPSFVIDREHKVTHWNKALEAISGVTAAAVLGSNRHWSAFYASERPCMVDLIVDGADAAELERHYAANSWHASKLLDGAYEAVGFFHGMGPAGMWLFFTAAPLRAPDGRIVGAIETLQDITERKYAEEELKEYRFHLEDLIERRTAELSSANAALTETNRQLEDANRLVRTITTAASDGIVMVDGSARIEFWNPAAARIFGYEETEVLGQALHPLVAPERLRATADAAFAHFAVTGEGAAINKTVELVGLRKGGAEFPLELSLAAISLHGEWRAVGIVRDITERKRLQIEAENRMHELTRLNAEYKAINDKLMLTQGQLLQSEKMASVGQLAAGVAHEINNPIGFVNSNLGSMEKYVDSLFSVIEGYDRCQDALGERLRDVVELKRDIDYEFIRADLVDLIAESRQGLTRVKNIVQALRDFAHVGSGEWQFADLHAGLESVLSIMHTELTGRGATVVKDYGTLPEVECLPLELNQVFLNLLSNAVQALEQPGEIRLRSGVEGAEVWIEVADSGKGIAPEHLARIFDPFFTTKPVGQGTGLGLSLAYATVKKHHGRIEVTSEPGRGTTFRVRLPLRQPVTE